jgi:uncharacterized protein YggE
VEVLVNRSVLAAPLVVAAVAGAFLAGGGGGRGSAAVAADPPAATTGVVVDGLGKVSGTPDVLRATLGVSVRRADVSTALQDANRLRGGLRAALKRDGVASADLQTSDVGVSPSYDSHGRRDGYAVSETVTVKLRDPKRAGQALTDAVRAGGDAATLQGVSFALEDNAKLLAAARDAAWADAKAKAQRYADLAGRPLGAVQLVTESTSAPQPVSYAYGGAAVAAPSASPVPIDAGTSQVSVSVSVRWALG